MLHGSPPRAWGGHERVQVQARIAQFTPTGVGRTNPATTTSARAPVHPHGRGEDIARSSAEPRPCGSPPRAWGGRELTMAMTKAERFTPTGVGRTGGRTTDGRRGSVHPHGRGEDLGWQGKDGSKGGSPPRAWGGPWLAGQGRLQGRFTPTGVGRTPRLRGTVGGSPVHPHGRGEDPKGSVVVGEGGGSPPRAWGGLAWSSAEFVNWRFTPTGVGRTHSAGGQGIVRAVHPHGRGEDSSESSNTI